MTSPQESEGIVQPEKQKEILDDNARKFVVGTLEPAFLEGIGASSFLMITDWLETGEDDERKLAHKKFANGDVQILLIYKIMKDGRRTSEKEKINEQEYIELLKGSVRHVEKVRYEFSYDQDDITFGVKYDEFIDSDLRVLEVDASNDEQRNAFDPDTFPSELSEVTGKMQYYGYRVADII